MGPRRVRRLPILHSILLGHALFKLRWALSRRSRGITKLTSTQLRIARHVRRAKEVQFLRTGSNALSVRRRCRDANFLTGPFLGIFLLRSRTGHRFD
jgi:hypothetical protein